MKIGSLIVLLLLAAATDLALRPWCPGGLASLDCTQLFLAWLALDDRRPRVHLAVLFAALLRSWGGVETALFAWLPLALTVEVLFFFREWFDLRPFYFRLPTLAVVIMAMSLGTVFPIAVLDARTLVTSALFGGVLTILGAAVMFPIFDAIRPLLRSARYPL